MNELEDEGVQAVTLEEQIKEVATLRSIAKSNKDILQMEREDWEKENREQIELVANTKADVEEAEDELRNLTLQAYAETGNKHPAVGVNINITTTYKYNPADALKWAKEHNLALSLDKPAFEKIAKADPPDFVTVDPNVPKATISTDLEVD
ncbi:hypothetical protein LCGC14_1208130 [marine sediment metagenome]|uniref:Uncharacterized protein n=1 Tax=marine sediment metagenome TaxID=412755 RepID=A0A0F9PJJ7_9ZZZZ